RHPCGGSLQENGDQRGHILQLEEKIRWLGSRSIASVTPTGRGECTAEEAGRGSEPGHADAAGCVKKKVPNHAQRRKMVKDLVSDYRVSLRRACQVSLLNTSVWYYKNVRSNDGPLRQRIRSIAETRVRYGIERIVVLLKREGWKDNHKRVYRIYKEEGLNLRVKRPRRCRAASHRSEKPAFSSLHDCWSMDFVADALFDGRKIRCLTVVDN